MILKSSSSSTVAMATKPLGPLQSFWADLTNPTFVPLKIIFFLFFGGAMTLWPFLTIFMRSLGISEEEIGGIYAFTPILGILVPPTAGMLADRIGNFKLLLSSMMVLAAAVAPLYLLVPRSRVLHDLPDDLPFNLTCSSSSASPELVLLPPYECQPTNVTGVLLKIESCTACRSSSKTCSSDDPLAEECVVEPLGLESSSIQALVSSPILHNDKDEDEGEFNRGFLVPADFKCPNMKQEENLTSEASDAAPCLLTCQVVAPRAQLCRNNQTLEVFDPVHTCFTFLIVRILHVTTMSVCYSLATGAIMAILVEDSGDYGLQRIYNNVGSMLLTPLSGALVDYASEVNGYPDYRPAIFLNSSLILLCSLMNLFINLEFKKPNVTILSDCKLLIKNKEIDVFLLVMMLSGLCFGVLDTYLFLFLEDLGASKGLMGLALTVGHTAGVIVLIFSRCIIEWAGHVNTIVFGFSVLGIRLLGYSLIFNPWLVMPFEALECFSVALKISAAATYAAVLATPATLATLQGLQNGLHYGVGQGFGSLIGGFLLKPLGPRWTFRFTALLAFMISLGYFSVNAIFFRRRNYKRFENESMAEGKREATELTMFGK